MYMYVKACMCIYARIFSKGYTGGSSRARSVATNIAKKEAKAPKVNKNRLRKRHYSDQREKMYEGVREYAANQLQASSISAPANQTTV